LKKRLPGIRILELILIAIFRLSLVNRYLYQAPVPVIQQSVPLSIEKHVVIFIGSAHTVHSSLHPEQNREDKE
jgi:hypothetical protein